MDALIEAARALDFPAEIVLVASNRPDAPGLARAKAAGLAVAAVDHKIYAGREEFERALKIILETHRVELICLAGFMRLFSPWFIGQWRDRLLNIHPALLPSYRGLNTHERALADGVKIHGCTVHFVVPEMDEGPIVAQAAVPVLDTDTAETLGARVLAQEHAIYPNALRLVASDAVRVEGNRVLGALPASNATLLAPP
jgi:phosphoribosylglycinamide formyltransferase 1